ncbi:hypothetical protein CAOG_07237 [Capsaspora owczarzaki ATCC 30864]|nr:hypothetical protein CAOG_07237 [Capsaspora owczarzaki ATCC 30864]|eukprot:XP_004343096.1 hypothetical protein CAOG_07237 [Capsaspora owczarzaki ATCC 30864]
MGASYSSRQRELFEIAKSSSCVILSSSGITDEDSLVVAEGLKENNNLQVLTLYDNQIGDAGAQAIGSALRNKANLSILYLSQNKIGDAGARAIAEGLQTSTALTDLRMSVNQIGDAGARAIGSALRTKEDLSILNLSENKISDIGACAIAKGLQTSSELTELWLFKNQIGDAGAQAIGSALRNMANLSILYLWDNRISSSVVKVLSNNLPAKCEFWAENQRVRVQRASILASSSRVAPTPAPRSNTASAPLAASDPTSEQVRQLQARIAQLESNTIPRVSLQVLSQATAQFSESKRIGGGGFGKVYSGVWSGQRVAVKRLAADSIQGAPQFEAELKALSRFRHPNIVTIMCFAQEGKERCLVYELMANGSIRDRLDRKDGTPALSWQQRRNIATDIANAMHFVQTAIPRQPLFHLDLKTDNVLLDAHFNAKVADFGLTRSIPAQVDAHSYIKTKTIAGTYQYICPQYHQDGKVSIKTDVYSYGMILLELLTGQPPSLDLIANVRRELKRSRKIDAVLDKAIDWSPQDKESAHAMAELAEDCLQLARVDRPSFRDILTQLSQFVDQGSAHAHATMPQEPRMEHHHSSIEEQLQPHLDSDLVRSRMEQQQQHAQSAEVSAESISRLSHPHSAIKEQLSPMTNSIVVNASMQSQLDSEN